LSIEIFGFGEKFSRSFFTEGLEGLRDIKSADSSAIPFGLKPEELCVQSAVCYKRVVRAIFYYDSVFEHDDTVGHADGRKSVRDDYSHSAFHEL
jgi:hypothetical protein